MREDVVLNRRPVIKRDTVTMMDVAREVGVSKMTVSYALNGAGRMSAQTRRAVLEAAERLGFERNPHAQRLSNGRCTNTIGLFSLGFDFGVGTQKIQLIQSSLNERGFDVPIYGVGLRDSDDEKSQIAAVAAIRRQRPRALVCTTGDLQPEVATELQRYQDEGGVLICYDFPFAIDCDSVIFDREDNTYRATRHLLELGHRQIGFGMHRLNAFTKPRVRGYERALREFGIEPRAEYILEGQSSSNNASGAVKLSRHYLELSERPTGMVILNDHAAMVFMGEVQRAGVRCPHDLSIVGHDDHAIGQHHLVPLSTTSHPTQSIADHVVRLLLDRLDGYAGPSRQIIVQGELLVRQSSSKPEQKA